MASVNGDPYAAKPWADPDPDSRAARLDDLIAADAWRRAVQAGGDQVHREQLAHEQAAAEDAEGWDDITEGWDDEPPTPTVIARTDGACCGYEGQAGVIGGASEGGKTRAADMATVQEMQAGRPVVRWDMENGPRLSRQALRDMGMTLHQAKELLRYRSAGGLWTPAKAAKEAAEFRDDGGRLVVMDSSTAIAHALGLEVSGGKAEDVQALYTQALHPWKEAGCCAMVIDNTNKAGPLDLSGSQHKKSGLDFGIGIVLRAPHGIGHHGSAEVYVLKDRGAGIRYVSRQLGATADKDGSGEVYRYFGKLTSTPNPHREGVRGRGVDFRIAPPEADALDRETAQRMEQDAALTIESAALYNELPAAGQPGKNRDALLSAMRVNQHVRIGKTSDKWDDLITKLGNKVAQDEGRKSGSVVYRRAE